MSEPENELEMEVEEEVKGVLGRYSVSVELFPGLPDPDDTTEAESSPDPEDDDTSEGEPAITSFVCHAKDSGGEVVATLAMHLPLNVNGQGRILDIPEDTQSQCISLAIVAMAKLLLLQEQSRPDFNPFVGEVAEA